MENRWVFTDDRGSFTLNSPHLSSFLYFPLANESGMMASISPDGHGDSKTSQNSFLLQPVSADDLMNLKSGRNFWLSIEGKGPWSCLGASAKQSAERFADGGDDVSVQAGFLWHKIIRQSAALGIRAETTSFVPVGCGQVELMRVVVTNTGSKAITVTPTAAIPIYGRSADNVRDHRHVTGLLGRAVTVAEGVWMQPAMTFDERGHKPNSLCYCVYGAEGDGVLPIGFFPDQERFAGEGGSLDWPEAVVLNRRDASLPGAAVDGHEAVGALRFRDAELLPGQSCDFVLLMAVTGGSPAEHSALAELLNAEAFHRLLDETTAYWQDKLGKTAFQSADGQFDLWMKWVTLQPVLRRIYGCSFLPHHDYGRGGRGWRDLWQDCLALLLLEPESARAQLKNHFGGVRLDGTNATIIGSRPGEFIADRNSISRVWSDHGVWPMFTTMLYLNSTGDLDFLFEQQSYFKDRLAMRCREVDGQWSPEYGNRQKTEDGAIYTGTILEHLLLQNLTAFYNVGSHNNVRIENADWNDALDLAWDRGETVAFTSFYASNLMELAKLLRELCRLKSVETVELGEEITMLFDSAADPVDYDAADAKRALLLNYYKWCRHSVTGRKVHCDTERLATDLERKALWMMEHVRRQEWIKGPGGHEWFNGYYDNGGLPLEGSHELGVRMTLTGQVFAVMAGVATDGQVRKVTEACRHFLYDETLGGYRLNTNFHEVKLDMGRCFGFAYGHKENGAVFSHMAAMYAFALYRRGFAAEGWHVLKSLYTLGADFETARIYPGIPEYFNDRGRGMYHYLTGSASWMLLVLLAEVYGVRGNLGDLVLDPKLVAEQFDGGGVASVQTMFAGRGLHVVYRNAGRLEAGQYRVGAVAIDGTSTEFAAAGSAAVIGRAVISQLGTEGVHRLDVELVDAGTLKEGH